MKNLEIIKHYQTIFSCDQFILTGSTALKFHGLVDSASDIDIILVNPTEECKKIIEKLEEKSNKQELYFWFCCRNCLAYSCYGYS